MINCSCFLRHDNKNKKESSRNENAFWSPASWGPRSKDYTPVFAQIRRQRPAESRGLLGTVVLSQDG